MGVPALLLVTSYVCYVTATWEEDVVSRLDDLDIAFSALTRQAQLQQFASEEMRRSDGDSGVKQVSV